MVSEQHQTNRHELAGVTFLELLHRVWCWSARVLQGIPGDAWRKMFGRDDGDGEVCGDAARGCA